MAPEQLEHGAPASVQTDLYAAGLILYEALVGRAATRKDGGVAPGGSARLEEPSRLVDDVDPALEETLMRLLAADPRERPRSAAEAADALDAAVEKVHATVFSAPARRRALALLALATGIAVCVGYFGATRWRWLESKPPICEQVAEVAGLAHEPHGVGIAVLPLADESEKRDQSSLAEAVQHKIIDRLEGIGALRVIAEDSSDRFGTDANPRNAGRELGVDVVSVGRIKGRADDPRIEITLYDVRKGEPLWSETYLRDADSSFTWHEADRAFVTRLTRTLGIDPGNATRPSLAAADTDSSTATLYMRGREHVPPYSEREFTSSVALLKQVIERDPRRADAYAAIATAYVTACAVEWVEPAEGYPVARRYAERALVLDPTLCEAHVAIALVAGEYDWDWAAAEASYQNALKVCPGSAWVYRSRGRFLSTQSRFKEALEATAKALELDPTSALMLQGAAQRFYDAHQYERAVALARIAKRLDPLYPYTYVTLGFALVAEGNYRQALDEFDRLIAVAGNSAAIQARRAYTFARAGDDRSATLAAAEARRMGGLEPAERAFLGLAEHDEAGAVAALAAAVAARAPPSIWLTVSPVFEPLRNRDDFRSLVATVGLPLVGD
jgi:TolB-like protein/tetratricopeptide (TPR) repeat protein